MIDWRPSDHPRVETLFIEGAGYQARWECTVPATRERCATCRKDLVPKQDGSLSKHKCEPMPSRHWKILMKSSKPRLFGTLGQAIAVAKSKAGIDVKPSQQEMFTDRSLPSV